MDDYKLERGRIIQDIYTYIYIYFIFLFKIWHFFLNIKQNQKGNLNLRA